MVHKKRRLKQRLQQAQSMLTNAKKKQTQDAGKAKPECVPTSDNTKRGPSKGGGGMEVFTGLLACGRRAFFDVVVVYLPLVAMTESTVEAKLYLFFGFGEERGKLPL